MTFASPPHAVSLLKSYSTPLHLAHFLLECPTWARQRGTFIVPILRKSKVHGWLGNPARRNDLVEWSGV